MTIDVICKKCGKVISKKIERNRPGKQILWGLCENCERIALIEGENCDKNKGYARL